MIAIPMYPYGGNRGLLLALSMVHSIMCPAPRRQQPSRRRMIRMKTQMKLILFSLTMAVLCTACVKGPEGNGSKRAKGTGPVRIGFSMDTLKEERWQRDKQLVEQRCKELAAESQVLVAEGSASAKRNQRQTILTQGVGFLIVEPH